MPAPSSHQSGKSGQVLLIIGILLIAVNLRPALASVGPLIEDIRLATGLSNVMLGLLTTLPLLCFGVVSVLAPLFTKRFGIGGTLLGALVLLTLGIVIRSLNWIPALYLGTLMFGIAIALGNVLLPSLTKRNFAENSGFITSLYSATMGVGAAVAAGLSVPLAHQFNLGWRGSLSVWAILSLIAFFVWLPQFFRLKKTATKRRFIAAMKHMGQSVKAWQVALFMGLQSLTFYVILAWLPAILLSRGYEAAYSGWMLSLSQATGIIGSLLIPYLAGKTNDQRLIIVCLIVIEVVGLIGILFPQLGPIELWVSLVGMVLGGTFGLALLLIVLRSSNTETATELSGMAQSIGYMVAAIGPVLFGSLFDLSGNWTVPLAMLLVAAALKLLVGLGAGKPGKIS